MEEVFEGIRSAFSYNETTGTCNAVGFMSAIRVALLAVQWTDPCILGFLVFHIFVWCCILAFRGNPKVLTCLCGLLTVGIQSHPHINLFARRHWKSISSRNYFDDNGIMIQLLWTTPLLLTAFVVLVIALVHSAMQIRKSPRFIRIQRHVQQERKQKS
eukprot:TRINITY_DN22901_c0_g1_i1.p1 TRINITY_DN22901_c0_g1~~TRINITY_DN22901_c0_g1_i1.p1  ORF type:complete len:158 (+),score=17.77 TRINITY_DN22901_c0_g1_i1:52-525(+)